jgi:Mn-dependent DtxR family transcriptional regulator
MGFVVYEKYRGFTLPEKVEKTAQSLAEKHKLIRTRKKAFTQRELQRLLSNMEHFYTYHRLYS